MSAATEGRARGLGHSVPFPGAQLMLLILNEKVYSVFDPLFAPFLILPLCF